MKIMKIITSDACLAILLGAMAALHIVVILCKLGVLT